MLLELLQALIDTYLYSHRWQILAVAVFLGLAYLLNKTGKR